MLLTGPYAESTDHLGAWTQSFAAPAGSIADELRGAAAREPTCGSSPASGSSTTTPREIPDAVAAAARERRRARVRRRAERPLGRSRVAQRPAPARAAGGADPRRSRRRGTPFVVVLENGRPLVVADWIDAAPAVVEAWHGGTEAAAAIVDVLLGDAEPAGRLPMSFPRSVGQVPIYYAHENTGRPATLRRHAAARGSRRHRAARARQRAREVHLEVPRPRPRTPVRVRARLGLRHLLARRRHEFAPPRSTSTRWSAATTSRSSVDVTNTSDRARRRGDPAVRAGRRGERRSAGAPAGRLRAAHHRARRAPRPSVRARQRAQLGFWATDAAGARFIVEPGLFRLHVGSSLERTQAVEFLVR